MAISQAKKLELITKHSRKFATKMNGASPVLEGVHYSADGSVVVTDRHKLLRIGGAHSFTQPFTSHAVTGAPIDGQYPDTSRIIPMELPTQITLISDGFRRDDVKDTIARVKLAVETAKVAGDKSFITALVVERSVAMLVVKNEEPRVKFSAVINAELYGPDMTLAFNAELFLAALNVFKDAGSKRVTIGLISATSPIVLRDEDNEIDAVVLPYRRSA
ncbi:DNA polymerase III beta subunit-like protein [Paenibacillus sp. BK033]|uniref:hypothetical protein n=1 Tax=Paenibacillus sp. BK033 TaxID=2512133 RepID=UPI00104BA907|nr:hypothetical protein [Paenibacillus sp. BK033]TCM89642.1 DNA polymerase III beta subunit-like protein [Paenibacillus sp. BK033]